MSATNAFCTFKQRLCENDGERLPARNRVTVIEREKGPIFCRKRGDQINWRRETTQQRRDRAFLNAFEDYSFGCAMQMDNAVMYLAPFHRRSFYILAVRTQKTKGHRDMHWLLHWLTGSRGK